MPSLHTPTISLKQRRELEQLAVRIFKKQGTIGAYAAPFWDELSSVIIDTVRHALALNLREINSSGLKQPRLLPELWGTVWAELNARDRLTVTQVSSQWRSLASRCPQLWTNLNMTTSLHRHGCNCVRCCPSYDDDEALQRLCLWCKRHSEPRLSSNVDLAQDLINRSGRLSLSLRARSTGREHTDPDAVRRMSTTLAPHVDRLRELDVSTDNPKTFYRNFFARLGTLSNLVKFKYDCSGELDIDWQQNLNLPSLEDFSFRSSRILNDNGMRLFAPKVCKLFCETSNPCDIALILHACPMAQDVTLSFTHMLFRPAELFSISDRSTIAEFLSNAKPSMLRLRGVANQNCTSIVDAFRSAAGEVVVEFGDRDPPDDLLDFICGIEGATDLDLSLTNSNAHDASLAVSRGQSLRRQLRIRNYSSEEVAAFISSVWTHLREPSSLRKIVVHSTLLEPLFAHAPDLRFTDLVINFDSPGQYPSLLKWFNENLTVSAQSGAFADLNNVDICPNDKNAWYFPIQIRDRISRAFPQVKFTTRGILISSQT